MIIVKDINILDKLRWRNQNLFFKGMLFFYYNLSMTGFKNHD